MQIRNDYDRIKKSPEIGDLIYISTVKYTIYDITNKSLKLKSEDIKLPLGFNKKTYINKNTFIKSYYYDKTKLYWRFLVIGKGVNMDYI